MPLHLLHKYNRLISSLSLRITEPAAGFFSHFVGKAKAEAEAEAVAASQKRTYVKVYMKWKKDKNYDSIEAIHDSIPLRPLITIKNRILALDPSGASIPVSAVSKEGRRLGLAPSMKVAVFLRKYPTVFQEFTGPLYNHPWFRLTPEAMALHREECAVYADRGPEIWDRLRRVMLMSKEKQLPVKVVQGLRWVLGLPEDFLSNLDVGFRVVGTEDEMKGLAIVDDDDNEHCSGGDRRVLSAVQRGSRNCNGNGIEFRLFPSPGLKLKREIANWLAEFQKLPYVSPYEDSSHLDPNSDVAEKRVVGVAHELLSLFVEHSVERKRLLILKKYLGLPQKFHKVFERHPHMFYMSLRNDTCTVILKEAFNLKTSEGGSGIEAHPLSEVRRKYLELMKQSKDILINRRMRNPSPHTDPGNKDLDLDLDSRRISKIEQLPL